MQHFLGIIISHKMFRGTMDKEETKLIIQNLQKHSKQLSVLFVDDEQIVRDSIYEMLQIFFKETKVCSSAEEVFDIYKKRVYDILILDISMPGIDGLELCRRIKEDFPKQAVIVLTAHSEKEFIDEAHEAHADAYITKPLNFFKDSNLIEEVCKKVVETKQLS